MILAVDVFYIDSKKYRVSGVIFEEWSSYEANVIVNITHFSEKEIPPYVSGQFKDRELPCLLKIIKEFDLNKVETIVIDGYAVLGNDSGFIQTLGVSLHQELCKLGYSTISIVGVAKTKYKDDSMLKYSREIYRGEATRPLYISSINMNPDEAANHIKSMFGGNKIPYLLDLADKVSKGKNK